MINKAVVVLVMQAAEGVAEEEVFSEGWHPDHFSCHGECSVSVLVCVRLHILTGCT